MHEFIIKWLSLSSFVSLPVSFASPSGKSYIKKWKVWLKVVHICLWSVLLWTFQKVETYVADSVLFNVKVVLTVLCLSGETNGFVQAHHNKVQLVILFKNLVYAHLA
jgi:hypothetical protein